MNYLYYTKYTVVNTEYKQTYRHQCDVNFRHGNLLWLPCVNFDHPMCSESRPGVEIPMLFVQISVHGRWKTCTRALKKMYTEFSESWTPKKCNTISQQGLHHIQKYKNVEFFFKSTSHFLVNGYLIIPLLYAYEIWYYLCTGYCYY